MGGNCGVQRERLWCWREQAGLLFLNVGTFWDPVHRTAQQFPPTSPRPRTAGALVLLTGVPLHPLSHSGPLEPTPADFSASSASSYYLTLSWCWQTLVEWMHVWITSPECFFKKQKRDTVAWGKIWGTERKTLVERDLNSEVLKTCEHPKVTHHSAPTFFLSESHSVMSDSLWPHRLYSPWNSPGQNTGVGSLSLLQGIFPTQGSNPGLAHCRRILYQLSHKGSPRILEWVALSLLQGIFPAQESNSGLLHWRRILYQLIPQVKPRLDCDKRRKMDIKKGL